MVGSTKRLGSRYGRRIRHKLDAIETAQKAKYKCPYCHKITAKRKALGIWQCPKCNSTFTGKAYTVSKSISFEGETGQATASTDITRKKTPVETFEPETFEEDSAKEEYQSVSQGEQYNG